MSGEFTPQKPAEPNNFQTPTDAEVLEELDGWRKFFADEPRRAIQLIRSFVPIQPQTCQKKSAAIIQEIRDALSLCWTLCALLNRTLNVHPNRTTYVLITRCPILLDAFVEYEAALEKLIVETDNWPYPCDVEELPPLITPEMLRACTEVLLPALAPDLLAAIDRAIDGFAVLLDQSRAAILQKNATRVDHAAANVGGAAPATATSHAAVETAPTLPVAPSETATERFPEFSGKQRKLLVTLFGKGPTLIDTVLSAVYGRYSKDKRDALVELKKRANRALAQRNYSLEIKKQGETLQLQSV